MLLIQGETKSAFRKDVGLRNALHHIASLHRSERDPDTSIEEIAAATVADTHDVKSTVPVDYSGPELPDGNIKAIMVKFEEALLARLRNTVKPRLLNSIPEKEKGDSKATDDAAEDVLISATRHCVVHEILDLILPAYLSHAPLPPHANHRELPHEEPAPAPAAASTEQSHPPPTAENSKAQDTSQPAAEPAQQQTNNHPASSQESKKEPARDTTTTSEPKKEAEPQPAAQQPAAAATTEPAPAPAAKNESAPPPTAAVVAHEPAPAPAHEEPTPALRYPLPEGTWTQCEDNPDFWWGEEAGLFYFPSAGHFMDAESGMWYIEAEDRWLTADEHEYYLSEMAQRGEY